MDNMTSSNNDSEMNKNTYDAIMGFGTKHGVSLAAALAVFFTSLVMANGLIGSFLAAVVVYIFSFVIVKSFFSH